MRPLVLVHGFLGGSEQWTLQAPLAENRKLIALDLPGFGKNAQATLLSSIGAFADWVLDQLTRMGVHQFDLLGHSIGGMIVQEMVRWSPHRTARLVLCSSGAQGVLPGRFETIETSMRRARSDSPRHSEFSCK